MLTIDPTTARRFILGKQGLWPGRRWRGTKGAEQAMRAMEHLQLDPLQIIARSQDIKLHSRVLDYTPAMWEDIAYTQRKFFDWGGWLAVRPMDELPHWRTLMRREREHTHWIEVAHEHAAAIEEMKIVLRERGTVSNRDFEMHTRKRTVSYRGRKDSALALYYLWRTGDVMVHHRERFERVYALTETVAPAHLIRESSAAEADDFMLKKLISFYGLSQLKQAYGWIGRDISAQEIKQWREAKLANHELIEVQIEGWKAPALALAADEKALKDVSAGRIPQVWKPLETTNDEEVLLLAPLDNVSARGRAKQLFGFDYVWEVYKPEHLRKYGYYTLPILWGDQLVARFDSKLDRSTNTFVVLGLWLEQASLGKDEAFALALANGLLRFQKFLGAKAIDMKAINPPALRKRLKDVAKSSRA
jgi:uncharacterized protein YcaQ